MNDFKAELTIAKERATELVNQIKSAKPLPGKQVILPGEHGDILAKQAVDSNEIEMDDAIWNELVTFVGN